MKVKVMLAIVLDIGDGEPDHPDYPNIPFKDREDDGWYEELQATIDNRLYNYSYADVLDRKWIAEELKELDK